MSPKPLRFISWLQRKDLMPHSASWATHSFVAVSLPETTLKGCGCATFLQLKDILVHLIRSLNVTRAVGVLLQTLLKPYVGTGALKQRVTMTLQTRLQELGRHLQATSSHSTRATRAASS